MGEVTKKKFFFVRHGTTEWNEKQLCHGLCDVELNETGRLEARLLGEKLQGFPLSRICVSPLKRALKTAEILQRMIPTSKLQVIDELKERDRGLLEGISIFEMDRIEALEERNPNLLDEIGMESREAFKLRVLRGVNMALEESDVPLIVSHQRVFLALCELLKVSVVGQFSNTTIFQCSPHQGGWEIEDVGYPLFDKKIV